MKRKIRGVKRSNYMLDYNMYRAEIPIYGLQNQYVRAIDLQPEGVEKTIFFQHGYAGVAESWEHQINHFSN